MGLGYVGLTFAVTLADIGFKVYGIEIKDDVLDKLKKGVPHFFEPGLEGRLKSVKKSQNRGTQCTDYSDIRIKNRRNGMISVKTNVDWRLLDFK